MKVEKRRAFIINVTYGLIIVGILFVLLKYALPLLAPFVLGFLFASALQRPIRFVSRKTRRREKPVAILAVVAFYAGIAFLLVVLGSRVFSGIQSLFVLMPHLFTIYVEPPLTDLFLRIEQLALQMDTSLFQLISEWDTQIMQSLADMVSNLSKGAVGAVSDVAAFLPGFFIRLLMLIISTFFFAADYRKLTGFCMAQLSGKTKALVLQIKAYLVGTLFVCIRSYAIIMSVTFMELSVGLTLIGLEHPVLIALCIAIFDILPVLGTGGIMIPWTVISLLSGRFSLALGLLLLYVFITVVRNILEPKIVGSQLGLHPVVTLASIFAGVQLFGVIGLFGFPITLSLLRYLNDNGTIHWLKPVDAE